MKKELTNQQKLFLEALFSEECDGDPVKAKHAAGYSSNVPTSQILKSVEEEVLEATRAFLSRNGPRAAISLVKTLVDPTSLGIKERNNAAKDILDRIGVVKTEKIEISQSGIFILPKKDDEE